MSENVVRHLVASLGTLVALLAYAAGYHSGLHGWWWTSLAVLGVYLALYHLIEA